MTTTQINNVAVIIINDINIMCTDRDRPEGITHDVILLADPDQCT